jgi:signal transduction histidine kinase
MRSLQVKIALILIGSIIAVLFVATGVTSFVISSGDATRMVGPMAEHIAFSAELLGSNASPADLPPRPREEIKSAPAQGRIREDLTAALKAALAAEGKAGTVLVAEDATSNQPVASYQLPDGRWAIFDFPRQLPPPPGLLVALGSWLALVAIGVVGVALVMARRVTQPFGILERAVSSVGADGVLPHIPEIGSGEARHTAAALNRLSDRLRASMESRMRLVAAAGHDLRTPMTRMRLRAEFLPDEERASWLADLDELDLIADSAIRLVREESAREDQEKLALQPLVAETVSELSAARLPVTLTATGPATVKAGPLSLRRALRNLITNAAIHGGGARVELKASGTFAQIVIDDDGPGIPDELMSQVFEPFFRVDPSRGKAVKGAGLGLAIAKEIVERFGGSIQIENRPEGGLRQTVTLTQVLP